MVRIPGPVKRAVFLDRDGVLVEPIVRDDRFFGPTTLDEFRLFDDAPRQIDRLRQAGFLCILFTNQPDVSRGLLPVAVLDQMHQVLRSRIALDDLLVCHHDDHHRCRCRKPNPGMIFEAQEKWGIDLKNSFAVGDRWRDIDAGRAAGCRTVLIEYPYSHCRAADFNVSNLVEAVDIVLTNR